MIRLADVCDRCTTRSARRSDDTQSSASSNRGRVRRPTGQSERPIDHTWRPTRHHTGALRRLDRPPCNSVPESAGHKSHTSERRRWRTEGRERSGTIQPRCPRRRTSAGNRCSAQSGSAGAAKADRSHSAPGGGTLVAAGSLRPAAEDETGQGRAGCRRSPARRPTAGSCSRSRRRRRRLMTWRTGRTVRQLPVTARRDRTLQLRRVSWVRRRMMRFHLQRRHNVDDQQLSCTHFHHRHHHNY